MKLVPMNDQRVLFLAYNPHQYKFFRSLCANLAPIKSFLLTSSRSFLQGIITKNRTKRLREDEIEQLVQYSFLSFNARRQREKEDLLSWLYYKYLLFKTRQLYKYYHRFLSLREINLLVVWNGAYLEAASGVKAARDLGIKVVFMENGFFPRTLVMDEKGVNARNSLVGKTADFYRSVELDPLKLANFKETKLVPRALRKSYTGTEEIQLPANYFFLPFQVHTDTQVLLNSPQIRNMYELVDTVYQALEEFNRKNSADYWLVIKEHPSDFGRIDYTDLKRKYQGEKVVFVTTVPSSQLIDHSQAVITINSTVGLEALLKGKPVITLGNAFYNVDGVVLYCRDLNKLDELMAKALKEEFDQELIDKFLYYLRYTYLVEVDKKHPTRDNITSVLNRIRQILARV